jgi:hypothetical protein
MEFVPVVYDLVSRDEAEFVPKMVSRVKLVAELEPGLTTEVLAAMSWRGRAGKHVGDPGCRRTLQCQSCLSSARRQ